MEEVAFQENGTKVAAVNTKTYIFQPEMSRGPESDLIRTINIPAVVRERPKPKPLFTLKFPVLFMVDFILIPADGDEEVP